MGGNPHGDQRREHAMAEEPVVRFRPTSGRLLGVIGLVLVAAVVAAGLLESGGDLPVPLIAGAVAFGVLIWSAMLRPRVWATESDLVLRNMFDTVRIPLAAIESVAVRQVLAVGAGDARYVSPAIGQSWRRTIKAGRAARQPAAAESYPGFVEERIRQLAQDAQVRLGVRRYSAEQAALAGGVRRQPAWVEIGVLAIAGLVFVVSLFA
jgi:hypothetical protein